MAIPFDALFALAAVVIFAVAAYVSRSLEAIGLACLSIALLLHFGIRVGG